MRPNPGSVAVVSLFVIMLAASAAYGVTWEAGLKLGANQSSLTGDPISLWATGDNSQLAGSVGEYSLGFIGGGYVKANFSDFWGIQAELQYTQMGGEGPVTGTAIFYPPNLTPEEVEFDGTLLLHLDYIEVPVLAVFSFRTSKESPLVLHGFFGPTFAFLTSAEVELKGDATVGTPGIDQQVKGIDQTEDAKPYVEDFHAGGIVGGSLSYSLDRIDILLDVRWGRGFTTIDNTTTARNSYNNVFSLQAGIGIPFGR
jgi:hypothetical protein